MIIDTKFGWRNYYKLQVRTLKGNEDENYKWQLQSENNRALLRSLEHMNLSRIKIIIMWVNMASYKG